MLNNKRKQVKFVNFSNDRSNMLIVEILENSKIVKIKLTPLPESRIHSRYSVRF